MKLVDGEMDLTMLILRVSLLSRLLEHQNKARPPDQSMSADPLQRYDGVVCPPPTLSSSSAAPVKLKEPNFESMNPLSSVVELEEPRILLPTKVYPNNFEGLVNECDDDSVASCPSSLVFQAYPNSLVQWTAQPVIKWIESLAAATENAELEDDMPPSIDIGGIKLSHRSGNLARRIVSQSAPSPLTHYDCSFNDSHRDAKLSPGVLSARPKLFDATFLLQYDRHAVAPVHRMNQLALAVEVSLPPSKSGGEANSKNSNEETYRKIYTLLEYTFAGILNQFPRGAFSTGDAEIRALLDTLYASTIRQLQRLVNSVSEAPRHSLASPVGSIVSATSSCSSDASTTAVAKKRDLGVHMTDWLLKNWTNPYPDDDGVAQLANECGVTPAVVSNWLINARTRKWRPAIVKATNLEDRPSSMLLEDSIRIFRGQPLRPLGGFASVDIEVNGDDRDDEDDHHRRRRLTKRARMEDP
jgi:hypothetical protein